MTLVTIKKLMALMAQVALMAFVTLLALNKKPHTTSQRMGQVSNQKYPK